MDTKIYFTSTVRPEGRRLAPYLKDRLIPYLFNLFGRSLKFVPSRSLRFPRGERIRGVYPEQRRRGFQPYFLRDERVLYYLFQKRSGLHDQTK